MPAPMTIESFEDVQYLMDLLFDQGLGVMQDGVQMAALSEFKALTGARSILAASDGSDAAVNVATSTDIRTVEFQTIPGRPVMIFWSGDGRVNNDSGITRTPQFRVYVNGAAKAYSMDALEAVTVAGIQSRDVANGQERALRNIPIFLSGTELPSKAALTRISIRDPGAPASESANYQWIGSSMVLYAVQC